VSGLTWLGYPNGLQERKLRNYHKHKEVQLIIVNHNKATPTPRKPKREGGLRINITPSSIGREFPGIRNLFNNDFLLPRLRYVDTIVCVGFDYF
jgi:hypothetical protein